MKFSIIIPHYNSRDTLDELLKSIPENNDIEVIVVDDNSTMLSVKDREKLKDQYKHVQFYENNTGNKGAGACRNIGITKSTGKWLLFADSDDVYLEGMYEIINSFYYSKSEIIFFYPTSFKKKGKSNRHLTFCNILDDYENKDSHISEMKLRYFFVVPWSKMIRRELVQSNNIEFEEIRFSNDILFSAKIGYHCTKMEVSPKKIYSVRESEGTMTSIISKERYLIRLEAWIDYVNYLKNNLSSKDYKKLNISGTPKLIDIIRFNLGKDVFLHTLRELKKNKIHILDRRIFNFKFVIKSLVKYKKIWKTEATKKIQ